MDSFWSNLQSRPFVPYAMVMSTLILILAAAAIRLYDGHRRPPGWDRAYLAPLVLPPVFYVLHWWLAHTPGPIAHLVARHLSRLAWVHHLTEWAVFWPRVSDVTGFLVAFATLHLLVRVWAVGWILRRCRPVAPDAQTAWHRALAAVPGMKVRPRLLMLAESAPAAMAVGAWRPAVVVTEGLLTTLDPDELTVVLVHELAHIRCRDIPLTWLALWLKDLMCFTPAAWLAHRRLLFEREVRCDELAGNWTGLPYHLARSLVKVSLGNARTRSLPTASHISAARGPQVERRVRRLLGHRQTGLTPAGEGREGARWARLGRAAGLAAIGGVAVVLLYVA